MDEHERALAALIEKARTDSVSAERITRTGEKLLAAVAAGTPPAQDGGGSAAGPGHATGQAAAAVHGATKVGAGIKLALALLALGGGGLAARTLFTQHASAPVPMVAPKPQQSLPQVVPAAAPVAAPAASGDPAAASPAALAPAPAPHASDAQRGAAPLARKPQAPGTSRPRAEPASFADELALIRAAMQAEQAGRKAEARVKLAEHARRFPEGQLAPERERLAAKLAH